MHVSPRHVPWSSGVHRPGTACYRRLRARASAWLRTCADYYDAAAMYEELSRLSDAELTRRGLDRPNLARDILRACDWDGRAPRD